MSWKISPGGMIWNDIFWDEKSDDVFLVWIYYIYFQWVYRYIQTNCSPIWYSNCSPNHCLWSSLCCRCVSIPRFPVLVCKLMSVLMNPVFVTNPSWNPRKTWFVSICRKFIRLHSLLGMVHFFNYPKRSQHFSPWKWMVGIRSGFLLG